MNKIIGGISLWAAIMLAACDHSNEKNKVIEKHPNSSSSSSNTSNDSSSSIILRYEELKKNKFQVKSSKELLSSKKKCYLAYSLDSIGNSLLTVKSININADDGSEDKIDYFFSKDRKSVLCSSSLRNETVNTIFTNSRQVISYTSSEAGIKVNKLSTLSIESKISVYMFTLATYVSHFDKHYLNFVMPSLNSMPAINLNCRTELKNSPNNEAKNTELLETGSHLFYLGCAGLDTVKGKEGVWYKVVDEYKKHSGWIFGDINCVELLTDDNW